MTLKTYIYGTNSTVTVRPPESMIKTFCGAMECVCLRLESAHCKYFHLDDDFDTINCQHRKIIRVYINGRDHGIVSIDEEFAARFSSYDTMTDVVVQMASEKYRELSGLPSVADLQSMSIEQELEDELEINPNWGLF